MEPIERRWCRTCERYRKVERFTKYSAICCTCEAAFRSMSKPLYLICDICRQKKLSVQFYYLVRLGPEKYRNVVCRACKKKHKEVYIYCKRMADRYRAYKNHYYRHSSLYQSVGAYDLYRIYLEQEGRCALSGKSLTCYLANNNTIFKCYPDNMILQVKSPEIGFTPENIQLICASMVHNVRGPTYPTPGTCAVHHNRPSDNPLMDALENPPHDFPYGFDQYIVQILENHELNENR